MIISKDLFIFGEQIFATIISEGGSTTTTAQASATAQPATTTPLISSAQDLIKGEATTNNLTTPIIATSKQHLQQQKAFQSHNQELSIINPATTSDPDQVPVPVSAQPPALAALPAVATTNLTVKSPELIKLTINTQKATGTVTASPFLPLSNAAAIVVCSVSASAPVSVSVPVPVPVPVPTPSPPVPAAVVVFEDSTKALSCVIKGTQVAVQQVTLVDSLKSTSQPALTTNIFKNDKKSTLTTKQREKQQQQQQQPLPSTVTTKTKISTPVESFSPTRQGILTDVIVSPGIIVDEIKQHQYQQQQQQQQQQVQTLFPAANQKHHQQKQQFKKHLQKNSKVTFDEISNKKFNINQHQHQLYLHQLQQHQHQQQQQQQQQHHFATDEDTSSTLFDKIIEPKESQHHRLPLEKNQKVFSLENNKKTTPATSIPVGLCDIASAQSKSSRKTTNSLPQIEKVSVVSPEIEKVAIQKAGKVEAKYHHHHFEQQQEELLESQLSADLKQKSVTLLRAASAPPPEVVKEEEKLVGEEEIEEIEEDNLEQLSRQLIQKNGINIIKTSLIKKGDNNSINIINYLQQQQQQQQQHHQQQQQKQFQLKYQQHPNQLHFQHQESQLIQDQPLQQLHETEPLLQTTNSSPVELKSQPFQPKQILQHQQPQQQHQEYHQHLPQNQHHLPQDHHNQQYHCLEAIIAPTTINNNTTTTALNKKLKLINTDFIVNFQNFHQKNHNKKDILITPTVAAAAAATATATKSTKGSKAIMAKDILVSNKRKDHAMVSFPFINEQHRTIQLAFQNINVLHNGRKILHDVSGLVSPGEVLAIMGPSGSGKTTLLDCLSGQRHIDGGSIYLNHEQLSKKWRRKIGYVQQEEVFFTSLTLRETVMYTALLRLPDKMPKTEKIAIVDRILDMLELNSCQHTKVGDYLNRGLSGGEKKRANIACELLTNPLLMLLDEPTSGLDSHSAISLMKLLKRYAVGKQKTVVITVHQPSSQMFHMFDKLLLLYDGKIAYFGEVNSIYRHFEDVGVAIKPHYNPADFVLEQLKSYPDIREKLFVAAKESHGNFLNSNCINLNIKNHPNHHNHHSIQAVNGIKDLTTKESNQELNNHHHHTHHHIVIEKPKENDSIINYLHNYYNDIHSNHNSHHLNHDAMIMLGDHHHHPNESSCEEASQQLWCAADSQSTFSSSASSDCHPCESKANDWLDYPTSFYTQFKVLSSRNFKEAKPRMLSKLNWFQTIGLALMAGTIWFQLPRTEEFLHDLQGWMFFSQTYWMLFFLFGTLHSFPSEREVVSKERRSGAYRLSAYYLAKMFGELPLVVTLPTVYLLISYPMLGCSSVKLFFLMLIFLLLNTIVAQSVGFFIAACCMDVNVSITLSALYTLGTQLFGGYFSSRIPEYLSWIRYTSMIHYAYQNMQILEFSEGPAVKCANPSSYEICKNSSTNFIPVEEILKAQNSTSPLWFNTIILLLFFFVFRGLGYAVLRFFRCPKT